MNVYDFDNTIYRGDSTAGFIPYCWRHRPRSLLNLPRTAVCGLLYLLHLMPKRQFKQNMYRMFAFIPDMPALTAQYAQERIGRIKPWYRRNQREDDLVISASPEFLVRAFCERIGIRHVIASPVDIRTGVYRGENCHGREKTRRLDAEYPDAVIEQFYSDSRSDQPLADRALRAFLVKGDRLIPWQ
jgi:phosphatidylglycerophosphatase C